MKRLISQALASRSAHGRARVAQVRYSCAFDQVRLAEQLGI